MKSGNEGMSPEAALLLLLSRTDPGDHAMTEAGELCASVTDWGRFATLCVRHGVAGLVWQNMKDGGLDTRAEPSAGAYLEGARMRTVARVTYITGSSAQVADELGNAGIQVIALKGLAFEHQLYGSRGLRQMSDADLLIRKEDTVIAVKILERMGFTARPLKSPIYKSIAADLGNHLPDMHRGGMSVDLHHRLFGEAGCEIVSYAIDHPERINDGHRSWLVLPPEVAFLSLVHHLQKHEEKGEFQVRLYADLFLLLQKHPEAILTDGLAAMSAVAGVAGKTSEVLCLMSLFGPVSVPENLKLPEGQSTKIKERFISCVEEPGSIRRVSPKIIYRETLRSLPGLRKKLIFITGDLFPSMSFMRQRYNCKSSAAALLYYPHRLGKLVWIAELIFRRGERRGNSDI